MTAAESQYEAALQLFLVIYTTLLSGNLTFASLSSALSSITMIGKAGAESFLTFQQSDKLEGAGMLKKLKLLLFYAPLFIITSIFRVGTLGVMGGWDRGAGVVLRWWEESSKLHKVSQVSPGADCSRPHPFYTFLHHPDISDGAEHHQRSHG